MQPGYADPVIESQSTFRAVLDAVAHPGRVVTAGVSLTPPPPLAPATAAIALTLFDFETAVWVDPRVGEEAREWLLFHTGALLVDDPARAAFALVTNGRQMPDLAAFATGTDDYPERSTTVVIQVDALDGGTDARGGTVKAVAGGTDAVDGAVGASAAYRGRRLTGPGIAGEAWLSVLGVPDGFWRSMRDNHALFPRGVDVLLVAGTALVALPRTTRIAS